LLLTSIVSSPTEDKVAIARSLLGSRLPLTNCETSEVDIPAHAELMIEDKVFSNLGEPEGPFGETSGYYFSDQSHVIESQPSLTARILSSRPFIRLRGEVALLCGPDG
jgi:2,5-furandicarboxylate decarboxylase 1